MADFTKLTPDEQQAFALDQGLARPYEELRGKLFAEFSAGELAKALPNILVEGQKIWDALDEETQASRYADLLELRIRAAEDGVQLCVTPLNKRGNPFGYRTGFVRESRSAGLRVTRDYIFTPLERDGEVVGWNRTGEVIAIDEVDPAKEALPVSETSHTIAVEAEPLRVTTQFPVVVKQDA